MKKDGREKNMEDIIFIPNNVPSSKNSKVWTGKYFVWSKTAQKYVKDTKNDWLKYREIFIIQSWGKQLPLKVSFKFVRKSRHQFDYVNPLQTILDLMVKYEWIEDDNADVVLPVFEPYEYDKENPGVYIQII